MVSDVSPDCTLLSQDGGNNIPHHDEDVASLVAALDQAVNLADLEMTLSSFHEQVW